MPITEDPWAVLRDYKAAQEDIDPLQFNRVTTKLQGTTGRRSNRVVPPPVVTSPGVTPSVATRRNERRRGDEPYNTNPNAQQTRKNKKKADNVEDSHQSYLSSLMEYKKNSYLKLTSEQQYTLDMSIKYVKSTEERDRFSTLKDKIAYLKDINKKHLYLQQKQFYLHKIFDEYVVDKEIINTHLRLLKEWKTSQKGKTLEESKTYYDTYCKRQQKIITNLLEKHKDVGENFALRYKRLTTPLYWEMDDVDQSKLTSAALDIRSTFIDYIKTHTDDVYYVFSEDLDLTLDIHTGIWRQIFSDGHKLMKTAKNPRTIETCGKINATAMDTELPKKGGKYMCPGCIEKELGTKNPDDTFEKNTDVKMAVDHCTPIKQAFLTYEDDALCAQLIMTCAVCNGIKIDTRSEEFIFKIYKDDRPVSMFKKEDASPLSKSDLRLRNEHYVKIHKIAISKGVKTFLDALNSAGGMTETYKTIKELEDKQVQQVLQGFAELTTAVPALLALVETGDTPKRDKIRSALKLLLFKLIDNGKGYMDYESITPYHINYFIYTFFVHYGPKLGDPINLDTLTKFLQECMGTVYFDGRDEDEVVLYIDILPTYIFQSLNTDIHSTIPIEKFKSLCDFMYSKHLDFVVDEIKKRKMRGSLVVDPTITYTTTPLEIDPESTKFQSAVEALVGMPQGEQGEQQPMDVAGKTKKKKNKKKKKRNKYTRRR